MAAYRLSSQRIESRLTGTSCSPIKRSSTPCSTASSIAALPSASMAPPCALLNAPYRFLPTEPPNPLDADPFSPPSSRTAGLPHHCHTAHPEHGLFMAVPDERADHVVNISASSHKNTRYHTHPTPAISRPPHTLMRTLWVRFIEQKRVHFGER